MKPPPLKSAIATTKALSDPQRVRILMLLHGGELCVCQIVSVLDLAASTVSKHLSVLSAAGLVDVRKDGRWAYYRLTRVGGPVRWLATTLADDPAIRADAVALVKIKKQPLEVLCRQLRPN